MTIIEASSGVGTSMVDALEAFIWPEGDRRHEPKQPAGEEQADAMSSSLAPGDELDPALGDVSAEDADATEGRKPGAKAAPKARGAKRLRQAAEVSRADGSVEVELLCTTCRRDTAGKRQASLSEFATRTRLAGGPKQVESTSSTTEASPLDNSECRKSCSPAIAVDFEERPNTSNSVDLTEECVQDTAAGAPVCRRCRRTLVVDHLSVKKSRGPAKTGCPFSARLKQYKRGAVETRAQWCLSDSDAIAIMRSPCCLCGVEADLQAGIPNGITRLRSVSEVRGMGPYAHGNVATACSTCNMIKGTHTVDTVRQICQTIATHHELGAFGRFPDCFVNNTSRRSRSSYLGDTKRTRGGRGGSATTAAKTHSLSNADFNKIVSQPCHYCGKAHDPPTHHNGLDRLDNSLRIYTTDNAVSCCGTCNMAKGRLTLELFLQKCRDIASHMPPLAAKPDVQREAPKNGIATQIGGDIDSPTQVATSTAGESADREPYATDMKLV